MDGLQQLLVAQQQLHVSDDGEHGDQPKHGADGGDGQLHETSVEWR